MEESYISKKTRSVYWPEYAAHFRNSVTEASYWSDLCEFCQIVRKDITASGGEDVKKYYEVMREKTKKGIIQPGTLSKKFRELHSFAAFLCAERNRLGIPEAFEDYFYGYIPLMAGQEKYARVVPVEDVDRLLQAAEGDRMAYTIFVLIYRTGLSSTELCSLKPGQICMYENGVFVEPEAREEGICLPEDAWKVLKSYLEERSDQIYLFYNSRGNQLNPMYLSRLMKKYTQKAGITPYSIQMLRNSCAYNLFSYHASAEVVAAQLGTTQIHIKRYCKAAYKENLSKAAAELVRIHIDTPF